MAGGGVDDFRALARDFQKAGATGCKKRLYAALYRSARPAIDEAKDSAASTLPKGGGRGKRKTRLVKTGIKTIEGVDYVTRRRKAMKKLSTPESLAERVSNARFKVYATRNANGPTVRITAFAKGGKQVDLDRLDKGVVRHPLFGDREWWYSQRVAPAWFTRPMERNAGNVQKELERAVEQISRDITGS